MIAVRVKNAYIDTNIGDIECHLECQLNIMKRVPSTSYLFLSCIVCFVGLVGSHYWLPVSCPRLYVAYSSFSRQVIHTSSSAGSCWVPFTVEPTTLALS